MPCQVNIVFDREGGRQVKEQNQLRRGDGEQKYRSPNLQAGIFETGCRYPSIRPLAELNCSVLNNNILCQPCHISHFFNVGCSADATGSKQTGNHQAIYNDSIKVGSGPFPFNSFIFPLFYGLISFTTA